MDTHKVIAALNKTIALEHCASLQYKQHALLVSGLWRKVFADFFFSHSKSSLEHAEQFGHKVVALSGVPTIEVGAVRQATEIEEMLRQDLALEQETLRAYLEAHALAEGNVALRTMLENQIESEQRDIEELEMYLGKIQVGAVEPQVNLRRA